MEISNEIKAKVFGQYLGQTVWIKGDIDCSTGGVDPEYDEIAGVIIAGKYTLAAVKANVNTIIDGDVVIISSEGVTCMTTFDKISLIIRPLSAITDEDALQVETMRLGGEYANRTVMIGYGRKYCLKRETNELRADVYQYLQSKGYDLPQYLLNGQTLKEAGLAVYE